LKVTDQDVEQIAKSDFLFRKEYSSPVLICYGKVEHITLGVGTDSTTTDGVYNDCENEQGYCYANSFS
jgi:hypothetical protein